MKESPADDERRHAAADSAYHFACLAPAATSAPYHFETLHMRRLRRSRPLAYAPMDATVRLGTRHIRAAAAKMPPGDLHTTLMKVFNVQNTTRRHRQFLSCSCLKRHISMTKRAQPFVAMTCRHYY